MSDKIVFRERSGEQTGSREMTQILVAPRSYFDDPPYRVLDALLLESISLLSDMLLSDICDV